MFDLWLQINHTIHVDQIYTRRKKMETQDTLNAESEARAYEIYEKNLAEQEFAEGEDFYALGLVMGYAIIETVKPIINFKDDGLPF